MASQSKRMWLHDEDDTTKILPYTTVDSIKIQPDLNQDEFLEFKDDYNGIKTTITNNKNQADAAINSLDVRVTALENNSSSSSGSSAIATHLTNGLMSKEDKAKLDGIEDDANNYVLPVATTNKLGGIKPDGSTTFVDNDGTLHAAGGGGGAVPLEALTNVEINTLLDNDLLVYDYTEQKWTNKLLKEIAGYLGGEISNIEYIEFDDIIDLFNTDNETYIYNLNKTY